MTRHDISILLLWASACMMILLLAGCQDRFRYSCQDPQNWSNPECKPPICTATGTCPDQLVKPEQEKK